MPTIWRMEFSHLRKYKMKFTLDFLEGFTVLMGENNLLSAFLQQVMFNSCSPDQRATNGVC